jgi:uncharacterized membrane protein
VSLVPALLVSAVLVPTLIGCSSEDPSGASPEPVVPVADAERSAPSPQRPSSPQELPARDSPVRPDSLLRGHLVLGDESVSFTPCDIDDSLPVIDETDGLIGEIYRELTRGPGEPLYAEIAGHAVQSEKPDRGSPSESKQRQSQESTRQRSPSPSPDGSPDATLESASPAADRPLLAIVKLWYASAEGVGCAEPAGEFEFTATGNEPFWNVRIATDEIIYASLARPLPLRFPAGAVLSSDGRKTYVARIQPPDPHRIRVTLEEKECRDTMADAYSGLTAQVAMDGQILDGCGRRGTGGRPRSSATPVP